MSGAESQHQFAKGWSFVAFASLAMACGCPPNRVDDLQATMNDTPLPKSSGEAARVMLNAVRSFLTPGGGA